MEKQEKGFLERLKGKKKESKPPDKEDIEKPKETEKKPEGLSSQVKDLNDKLDMLTDAKKSKAKKKNFPMNWGHKGQLKTLANKSKVQVLLLSENKNMKPTIGEIKSGMLLVGDKIYNGSADSVWLWNGKIPTMIVKEWDIQPLNIEKEYHKAVEDGRIAHPQTIMIRAMEFKEAMQPKGQLSSKAWILIGVALIAGAYVLFGNPA